MTMETALIALLKALLVNVFADVAPAGTKAPYITWQALGGESIYALNNTPIDKRHTLMQVSVWATTRQEANTLVRNAEAAIAESSAFVAKPAGEAVSIYEDDTKLHGAIQRFEIWHAR